MKNKKVLSMVIASALAMTMTASAFAAGNAATMTEGKSENVIPVQISAQATVFDVTVPTSFPLTVDPSTGEATAADNAVISNGSYGAIKVAGIKVQKAGDWHLAAYDTDMSKEDVDSNKIGVQIAPKGGSQGRDVTGTALSTTNADDNEQVLLASDAATASQWVINGKEAGDGSNELTVDYKARASAVSASVLNETVANIIITVAWNA